jgi:hypothetical protein
VPAPGVAFGFNGVEPGKELGGGRATAGIGPCGADAFVGLVAAVPERYRLLVLLVLVCFNSLW